MLGRSDPSLSALGQKPTYALQQAMSALPPKADMCSATRDVRFGPKADIRQNEFEGLPIIDAAESEEITVSACHRVSRRCSRQKSRERPSRFQKARRDPNDGARGRLELTLVCLGCAVAYSGSST